MDLSLINDSPHLVLFDLKENSSFGNEKNVQESSVTFKGFIEVFV
jgi:hypothetical protein